MKNESNLKMNLQLFGASGDPVADPVSDPVTDPASTGEPNALELLSKLSPEELVKADPIKALLEKARAQEKDKVYKSIKSKEDQLKEAQVELARLKAELDDKQKASLSDQEKVQLQITELVQAQEKLQTALREAELKAYREAKLRDAGTELILEFVGGKSEEEIDQSIELAKAKYQEIVSKVQEQMKPGTPPPKQTVPPTNPPGSQTSPMTLKDLGKMDRDTFIKNRDEIIRLAISGELK